MKNKNLPFFILTASVFVFLVLPSLFKEGLFMDGLIYAAISKNLANGLGSFWSPYFTATFLPSFHEHPPLAFGLQSIFFDVLGDAFYVEKIYSLFTAIIQGVIIIAIWRSFSGEKYKETFWLPIFLWITIPLCFWTYSNNMLENTMAMFTTSAILMQLLAFKRSQPQYLLFIISAVLIFLAFLSKGLPGLFPLAFPFIHWIVLKKLSFSKYLKSFLFLIVTLAATSAIIFLIPEAIGSLKIYFQTQIFESLSGERVQVKRYYIVQKMLQELIPALGLTVIILFISRLKNISVKTEVNPWIWVFVLTGLSASVPIVISPKQLGFYLVPSLPFFALGISVLLIKPVTLFLESIKAETQKKITYIMLLLFLTTVIFSILQIGKFERDKDKIEDIKRVGILIGNGEIITICPQMHQDWSLHGYFSRYFNISLEADGQHQYRLRESGCGAEVEVIESIELNNYILEFTKKTK